MRIPLLFACVMPLVAGYGSMTPVGSIPPDTIRAVAEAGGGCISVNSQVAGNGSISVGATEKGALKDGGEVNIKCGPDSIQIKAGESARRTAPVPGTVTTTTVPPQPGTVTTTVTPAPKP